MQKFLEPTRKPKVIYTDNSLEFGIACEDLSWGLDEKWWAESMECHCYLRNVQDLVSDAKTSSERRFGEPFKGPIIPFGAMVEDYPISARDQARLHQFGWRVFPGIFLGYAVSNLERRHFGPRH